MLRIFLFFLMTVMLGQSQDSVIDPYSGPEFQALVRKADPLPVEESLKAFDVPDGFGMELVAVSPEIGQPMNLAFDERGRLWVSSTLEYPYAAPLGQPGRDTIKVFEDTTGDGRYDKISTFADGLNIPDRNLSIQGRRHCVEHSEHLVSARYRRRRPRGQAHQDVRAAWLRAGHARDALVIHARPRRLAAPHARLQQHDHRSRH